MHDAAMATGGRNERRKARTRASLIAAARGLFAAQGIEETTIGEIAEGADIAVGSFYNHFAGKEELLSAVLENSLGEQLARIKARQAQVESPAERVSIAHRTHIETARADPDWGWLLVRLEATHQVGHEVNREAALRDLHDGIASGEFAVPELEVAWRASAGALLGVIHGVLLGELPGAADTAHAEGVLRLFGVPPARAAQIARRPLPQVSGAS